MFGSKRKDKHPSAVLFALAVLAILILGIRNGWWLQ